MNRRLFFGVLAIPFVKKPIKPSPIQVRTLMNLPPVPEIDPKIVRDIIIPEITTALVTGMGAAREKWRAALSEQPPESV